MVPEEVAYISHQKIFNMNEKIFYEIDENFWCETRYLNNVYDIIKDQLIGDYSIVITPNLRTLPKTNYKKIVILTGDELGRLESNPYPNDDVAAIFRIYNVTGRFDEKFIFPIPCGYNWTMHSDPSKKMVKMYPDKKISERKYDIFYSGQMCIYDRSVLMYNLNQLISTNKFNILSQVTPTFRSGVPIDEYYKLLGDTKISLAPDGTSVDTFRYTESFGSGCIVISTNKNDIWYYRNSPVFLINSWNELNENLINHILSLDIDDIYIKNLQYYKDYLSEDAVANYIIRSINK